MPTSHARGYYQLVFLWMRDPATFARYAERLAPIVGRYGGDRERMIVPSELHAEGLTRPDVVNVVFYDDRDAFTAFGASADFQAIVDLRARSVDLASVTGLPIAGDVTETDLASRRYLIEIARFGPDGADGYRRYEREATRVMAPYGYHVERVIAADGASGFPFTPDLVKVAYFDRPDGLPRVHADPEHPALEAMYPAAVAQSIWVIGAATSSR